MSTDYAAAPTCADALELARKLRYDLTAMQAKTTKLINALAAASANEPSPKPKIACCLHCGVTYRTHERMDEHIKLIHGDRVTT